MALTVEDITNPEALKAYLEWNPENPSHKTPEIFLATVGKKFADNYNKTDKIVLKKEVITGLGSNEGDAVVEEDPVEIPDKLSPELAKQIDEDVNKLEEEYSYANVSQHKGFASTFALYGQLKEGFKVGEKGSLAEVAFQLAQCEARMGMFNSLGKDNYPQLLKDSMDSIALELATNQMIFNTLKMDPLSLSEANRDAFYKKHEAEIKAFLNGKGKEIKLSSEVVTATLAMHHKAVSQYGDELQKQYGVPTLRQRVKSLDARLTKRYGKWWNLAKTAGVSLAAGAVFGPAGIAGVTAYRTYKKMREYSHEAKVNGIGLLEHLKQNPIKIAEVGLSLGTTFFAGGAALGFEDALTAKLITSGMRGVANESVYKSIKAGKYGKAGGAAAAVAGATFAGLFLHSEHGHELMQGFYEKAGGFFQKLGIWPQKSADTDLDTVSGADKQVESPSVKEPEPAPAPKVSRPTVHHSAPKPVVEPTPQSEPIPQPQPQYSSLKEKLVEAPEKIRPNDLRSLMDDRLNDDINYATTGLNQGLNESRNYAVNGLNGTDNDTGISDEELYSNMNTASTNRALLQGHDMSDREAVLKMEANDTMRGYPWIRDPDSYEVANPIAFEDTMMGYGNCHGPCPSMLPVYYPKEVVVVRDYSVSYSNNSGNYIDHIPSRGITADTYAASSVDDNLPQGGSEGYVAGDQEEVFDSSAVAIDEPIRVEDVITSNLSENVYTNIIEGEDGDTFTSKVYDINGNLLETREGDVSYDVHGNKVTSFLAYKENYPEGKMPENPDRTTIVEDRESGQIISKDIEDSDGNIIAKGQDFLYNNDGTPSSYTMHNFADDTYDHHSFEYQNGRPSHEGISKVSTQGKLISTEDIYNTTDENGNINYMHAMMDGNNQVEFCHRIYTNADGEHEIHSQRGIGSTEHVTKDGRLVWEKTADEAGNATRTEYQYDESGKEIGRTVKTYKDNELIGITQTNGDKVQEFDGNGNLIKQTPPIEKPTVEHSATPKATEKAAQEATPVSDKAIEETSEKTEVEEIEKKTEEVKKKMRGLPGISMMVAGGAIAVGGVTAAALANKKQKD